MALFFLKENCTYIREYVVFKWGLLLIFYGNIKKRKKERVGI